MITLKSNADIQKMREAGRLVALAIQQMAEAIKPGITTGALDAIGERFLEKHGAKPSFKGYRGYSHAVCISVNEEVVHGIPGSRTLNEGDIVSLDIGAFKDGYHGDSAWTFPVGEIDPSAARLLNVTKECLIQGIAQARPGKTVGDISAAIQTYAEKNGYSPVRDLTGHGIGRSLHEEPSVPNFGRAGAGPRLRQGMTLCIEPMINMGKYDVVTLEDGWTVVTKDGKPSAHFEHTVLVADGAAEILTKAG